MKQARGAVFPLHVCIRFVMVCVRMCAHSRALLLLVVIRPVSSLYKHVEESRYSYIGIQIPRMHAGDVVQTSPADRSVRKIQCYNQPPCSQNQTRPVPISNAQFVI